MNSETVKPMPASAAAPQSSLRVTPSGSTPTPLRSPARIAPPMPSSLPSTSPTATAQVTRLDAAAVSAPPPS